MLPKKQWQPAMLNTQKDLPQEGEYYISCFAVPLICWQVIVSFTVEDRPLEQRTCIFNIPKMHNTPASNQMFFVLPLLDFYPIRDASD